MPKAGITYSKTRIKAPDYRQIAKDAEQEVLQALAPAARPDDRIVQAAELVRQADAEIVLHAEERNNAVASLWFYDQVLGLSKAIGVTDTAYREILSKAVYGDATRQLPNIDNNEGLAEFARKAGVPHVPNAENKLLEPARVVVAARARRKVAVRFMQDGVLALSQEPYGWTPEKIAEHAGVTRSLIYRQRDAAQKRAERAER